MVQALITVNAVAGSNPPNGTALAINSLVSLSNTGNGGELTYLWEFLDRPEGSSAAFSNDSIQSPSFTPDVEGTYLIKLTVNRNEATERVNTVIAAVPQVRTNIRIPAAGETREESTLRGWAESVNRNFQLLDQDRADGGMLVGQADASMARGNVLRVSSVATILSGTPGESIVPVFSKALASSASDSAESLYLLELSATDGTSAASGELVRARSRGVFGPYTGTTTTGSPVYLGDTGLPSLTAGTNTRRIGTVVAIVSTTYFFHFEGASGGASANEPFVFRQTPTGAYPNSVDMTALQDPFELTPSLGINTLILNRFSDVQGVDVLAIQSGPGGDEIFGIDKFGNMRWAAVDVGSTEILLDSSPVPFAITTNGTLRLSSAGNLLLQIGGSSRWQVNASTGMLEAVGGNRRIGNVADPNADQQAATKKYTDTFARAVLTFGNAKISTADSENLLDPGYTTRNSPTSLSGAFPQLRVSHAGVLRNLYVNVRIAPTGANIVIEILVNGTPTGIAITLIAGADNADYSDITHSAAVVVGDKVLVRAKAGGVTLTDTEDVIATFDLAPA